MSFVRDILSTARAPSLEALEERRLFAFGQADTSFGNGGRVTFPLPGFEGTPLVDDIEVGSGGGIVAGGIEGLVRWNSDGQLDAQFGVNGFAAVTIVGGAYRDHDVASNGRIYQLVESPTGGGVVVRYDADGTLDDDFGAGGVAVVSMSPSFSPIGLVVQGDGKVVVAGTVRTDGGKGAITRVYRLESDGGADLQFGNNASIDLRLGGVSQVTPVERDIVVGVALDHDGNIVVGGSSLAYSPEFYDDEAGIFRPVVYGDTLFAAARLTHDGQPDGNYGAGGVARATYANGSAVGGASAFALKEDGSVGLATYAIDSFAYAQFSPTGTVDFNRKDTLSGLGKPFDMAAKRDGRLMFVALPHAGTGSGLQVAYITPTGELSNVVRTSDSNGATIDLFEDAPAAIAVADDGNILVGGRPSDGSEGYAIVKIDDGKTLAERPDEFVNARGNDIVRDEAGGVHFAYFDAAERVLKYAYEAPNGLWNAPVTIDPAPESGHYLSIALDANGRPGIAYFDGTMGDLKYAFSPVPGTWDTQVVESAGLVGLYPSLKFDSVSRATVAYYKKTGGDLKLAVLVDGAWAYELIDEVGDVGRSTVLVPQPLSGRWSIAYTDATNNAVKLAWRTKLKVWQIETAATTAGGADYLSMAYNPFTEPAGVYLKAAISYYDAFAGDLKITQSDGLSWSSRVLSTQGITGLQTGLTFDAFYGPTVYFYNRSANKVTRLTDSFYDGITADTVVEGGGRFLSVFSNGTTVDLAYYDDVAGTLKVRTIPVKV